MDDGLGGALLANCRTHMGGREGGDSQEESKQESVPETRISTLVGSNWRVQSYSSLFTTTSVF